jgi:hypothetical protein
MDQTQYDQIKLAAYNDELEKIALSPELLNRASYKAAERAKKLLKLIDKKVKKGSLPDLFEAKKLIGEARRKSHQGIRLGFGGLTRSV